ncbi:MAG: PQQ-binding-like beta-propeller repeat protein [Chloroflexota bacterium]
MPRNMGPDVGEDVFDAPVATTDDFAPLRVWLEPGYDGRIAAWVTDVPGVLAVADTRDRALSGALTVTGRVREWLEAHGDEVVVPRIRRPEIAGEIPTVREADGYEAKAVLPPDLRPVSHEEAASALRHMAWARQDQLDVLGRIDAWEAGNGPLPCNPGAGERTPLEIARHLAGAEVWVTGRLPGAGRFDGRLDDGTIVVGNDRGAVLGVTPEGQEKWRFATGATVLATPAIARDGTVIVGSYDQKLYAIDAQGHLRWQLETHGRIRASARIDSAGRIYVGSQDDGLYAVAADGRLLWRHTIGQDIDSTVALGADGTIYLGADDYALHALR